MKLRLFHFLLPLLACAEAESPAPAAELAGSAPAVPTLVEEPPVIPPLDAYPTPFGMGSGPTFLSRARSGSSGALIRFGRDRTPMYFSRVGDGPGEVRDSPFLSINDSALVVFDFANVRFATWDTAGAFIGQTRLRGPQLLSGPGSAAEWLAMSLGSSSMRPLAIDASNGQERYLLPATDSFLAAELDGDADPRSRLGSVGKWDDGFLVANGRSYRIGGYDWEGRLRFVIAPELEPNLPSAERLEELMFEWKRSGRPGGRSEADRRERFADTPEQWFSHLTPPRMDADGRVWVVGRAHGQLFADAWWRNKFLGRTLIECPGWSGRWNVAGTHIALPCASEDPESDVDQVYRVWRIVPDSTAAESP
jgi:hypothetical protein